MFPDFEQRINKPIDGSLPKIELDDLSNILSKIDRGQLPSQLDFFTGGKNEKFENKAKLIGLSTNSSQFVDFIQTGFCKQILQNNKLKIHIKSEAYTTTTQIQMKVSAVFCKHKKMKPKNS